MTHHFKIRAQANPKVKNFLKTARARDWPPQTVRTCGSVDAPPFEDAAYMGSKLAQARACPAPAPLSEGAKDDVGDDP